MRCTGYMRAHECLQPAVVLIPFYNGPENIGKQKFKGFYDVGPIVDMTKMIPYDQLNSLQV